MKHSKIQQELHPLIGYFAFLVFASLFVCKIAPTVFLCSFKIMNFESVAVAYTSYDSFLYGSLYLFAVFFISPSYITVPNYKVESLAKDEHYFIASSNSKIEKWFEESFTGCLFWLSLNYIAFYAFFFIINSYLAEHNYSPLKEPSDILHYASMNFNFVTVFAISGLYLMAGLFVLGNSSFTQITVRIFQLHLWKIKIRRNY